ncbi:MAG: hypothetical protein GF400_01660, partial [Candidatus Eisenbacteria bacterium]|nr:hypothetical protein [Candidatus Eisenbacteria bacterium]
MAREGRGTGLGCAASETSGWGGRPRVLICGADAGRRALHRRLVESEGYDAEEADSLPRAVESALAGPPDVAIIVDGGGGADALKLCRSLKDKPWLTCTQLVVVAALLDRETRTKGLEAGADEWLADCDEGDDLLPRVRNRARVGKLLRHLTARCAELPARLQLGEQAAMLTFHDALDGLCLLKAKLGVLAEKLEGRIDDDVRTALSEAQAACGLAFGVASTAVDTFRLESKTRALELSTCDLRTLIREAAHAAEGQTGRVELAMGLGLEPMVASCDRGLIRRVVSILLSNAVSSTPEGGTVRVRVRRSHNGNALVSVSDEGKRIPEEYHRCLFDRDGQVGLRSGSLYSSGIGLVFCRLAVEAHGGTIGVNGGPGMGNTFWFTVP